MWNTLNHGLRNLDYQPPDNSFIVEIASAHSDGVIAVTSYLSSGHIGLLQNPVQYAGFDLDYERVSQAIRNNVIYTSELALPSHVRIFRAQFENLLKLERLGKKVDFMLLRNHQLELEECLLKVRATLAETGILFLTSNSPQGKERLKFAEDILGIVCTNEVDNIYLDLPADTFGCDKYISVYRQSDLMQA